MNIKMKLTELITGFSVSDGPPGKVVDAKAESSLSGQASEAAPPGSGSAERKLDGPRGTIGKEQVDRALVRHMQSVEQFLHLSSDTISSLIDLNLRVHRSLDLNKVLAVIIDRAGSLARSEANRLFLVEHQTGILQGVFPDARGGKASVNRRYERGRGIAGWAADNDALVIVADVRRDARFDAKVDSAAGVDVQSVLAVPLRVEKRCIGVLELINKIGGPGFSEQDALLLSLFAEQAASAIDNAQVYGELADRFEQNLQTHKQVAETEKYRALEEFGAGVSHDFKNLLSAILGFSEIVFLDLENETLSKDVMEIISATKSAITLVNQIHMFSRHQDQEKSQVSIQSIVTRSIKQFQTGTDKSIDIRHDLNAQDNWLMVDPSQLHQALMHLLENASEALPAEGGTIRIATDRVTVGENDVDHEGVQPGTYVELLVRDNGKGMESEVLQQIFEPYFTTKARGVGTGLGLPLVRGVVQGHGGAVTAESRPGEGTTVRILLPSLTLAKKAETDAYEGLPRGTEQILLVEDDPVVALAVEKRLHRLGYTVFTVDSANAALELYRKQSEQLDLVITDWSLPGIRGDRLAAMMWEIRPSVRVIVYSAYAGNLRDELVMSDAIRDVLRKPVEFQELAQKVRKALDA